MSKLTTRLLTPDDLREWDAFVGRSESGLLFHTSNYLRHVGDVDVVGVYSGDTLEAGFAVPVVIEDGERKVKRASYVCPYFTPVFRTRLAGRVRADRRARAILTALVGHLQAHYAEVVIPLHPDLTDMVPFQQAHFCLELRHTYHLRLDLLDRIWRELGDDVRNHVRRASGVHVEIDARLDRFDLNRAVFYEDSEHRGHWSALVRELVKQQQGVALVARRDGTTLGGLFLARHRGKAYNLLSYVDRGAASRGVAPRLVWSAIQLAHARGDALFDFEGSVLPSIESFFQSFGGDRTPYFQIHWHREEHRIRPPLYHYT